MTRCKSASAAARLLAPLLVLVALAVPGAAQRLGPEEARAYQESFTRGTSALKEGRFAEGIAAFERCLELLPGDPASTYNVACGHALAGERDEAFAWLERAADAGFGDRDARFELARTDPDLQSLRSDPRFAAFVERMAARRRAIEECTRNPAVYVPEALAGAEELPLLVVLHDEGRTKEQVVAGPWRRVADALGMALVAPSGAHLVGRTPDDGMAWFDDPQAFVDRYHAYEQPVHHAVIAFQKLHAIDRRRVVVAGEGQGGLLAASVAMGSPGLFKGLLVVDAALVEQLASWRGPSAGKVGLRAVFLLSEDGEWLPSAEGRAAHAERVRKLLASWSMAGEVRTYRRADGDEVARLAEAVGVLLAREPAEAPR